MLQWRAIALFLAAMLLGAFAPGGDARAQTPIEVDAVAGEPFGVGRIVADLPPDLLPAPLGVDGLGVGDKDGRALYPALHSGVIGPLVKEILGADSPLTTGGPVRQQVGGLLRDLVANRPPRATIYFLFRGDGPLEVTLQAARPIPLQVAPRHDAAVHRLWLDAWWREYTAPPRLLARKPEYPPLLENYLASTLARRLNLRLPQEKQTESAYTHLEHEAGAMLETESILTALEQDRILGMTNLALPADQPLPEPVDPPPLVVPEPDAHVKVEPIALHVPAECFYVRFGSYSNFLWMQDTLDRWGGDLQNLLSQRGLDYGRDERMQDQLILRQTELSRLLGDTVISDVAIIGADMFFREGAAYGFLFEARNNFMLGSDLGSERSDRLRRGGVSEEKLKLAGREVSLISSPDGSVRSYYAQRGDYHFITSSRALAERFVRIAKGAGSLGASQEFRHARTIMPLARNDTVFVYLSDAFFRNITGPRYRVEMMRRLEAVADVELVRLAALASTAEGRRDGTIEQLIAGGLLPGDFGPRPDGSRAVLEHGAVYDQLRGRRGSLIPVPDVPLGRVTAAEAASCRKFADFYRTEWGRLDPVLVGLKRTALPDRREQIALDLRMTPLDRRHFDFFSQWVGAADKVRLAAIPGDMAAGEVILRQQRLFGGLRDVGAPGEVLAGPGAIWQRFRNVLVGYIGSYGPPGVLGLLDLTIPAPPDANGYASNALGLWRRQFDHFSVYSFQPDVLAAVTPQLRWEERPRPAQAWLHVGDVSQARVTPALNRWAYGRTRETALGNLRLMHALEQHLHVPAADCKQAAESLLAARLICPLGGSYVFRPATDGPGRWTSTALEAEGASGGSQGQPPPGYVARPLTWFRGLDLEATMIESSLSAHAEILMQLPTKK
jgi:hypothetical protein